MSNKKNDEAALGKYIYVYVIAHINTQVGIYCGYVVRLCLNVLFIT